MTVASLVKFVQGATVGTPGQALFGATGTAVQVSNGSPIPGPVTVWTFTVIAVPVGSSVPVGVAQTGAMTTWTFTPDVKGCYIVEVTVEDAFGNVATDARAFGIKTTSGRFIPSFTGDANSLNFGGQTSGWDPYMEAWLQALETLINGGAGGPTTYSQDCTAGGVISYGGPTPIPEEVVLTGTPGTGFGYQFPNGQVLTNVVNNSNGLAFCKNTHFGGVNVAPDQQVLVSAPSTGGYLVPVLQGLDGSQGDVIPFNGENGIEFDLQSIGNANNSTSGVLETVPINGAAMNQQAVNEWDVTPPNTGAGPNSGQAGSSLWQVDYTGGDATLVCGYVGVDSKGGGTVIVPTVYYPIHPWDTQLQQTTGAKFGDMLTGPSASTGFVFEPPIGVSQFSIRLIARVVSTTGSTEAVDDLFALKAEQCMVLNTGGVATAATTLFGAPNPTRFGIGTNMETCTAGFAVSGSTGIVTFETPSTLDPSTVVDIQIHVFGDSL